MKRTFFRKCLGVLDLGQFVSVVCLTPCGEGNLPRCGRAAPTQPRPPQPRTAPKKCAPGGRASAHVEMRLPRGLSPCRTAKLLPPHGSMPPRRKPPGDKRFRRRRGPHCQHCHPSAGPRSFGSVAPGSRPSRRAPMRGRLRKGRPTSKRSLDRALSTRAGGFLPLQRENRDPKPGPGTWAGQTLFRPATGCGGKDHPVVFPTFFLSTACRSFRPP